MRIANTLRTLAVATFAFTSLSSANAAATSGDFVARLSLPNCCGPAIKLFANPGASIGAGTELTSANYISGPYTGAVSMDIDPIAQTLTLFVTETFGNGTADFQHLEFEVSNLVFSGGEALLGFFQLSNNLTGMSDPYNITLSNTGNLMNIVFDVPSGILNLQIEGSAVFGFETSSPVPEPGALALLGIGLAGVGIARRKRAH